MEKILYASKWVDIFLLIWGTVLELSNANLVIGSKVFEDIYISFPISLFFVHSTPFFVCKLLSTSVSFEQKEKGKEPNLADA